MLLLYLYGKIASTHIYMVNVENGRKLIAEVAARHFFPYHKAEASPHRKVCTPHVQREAAVNPSAATPFTPSRASAGRSRRSFGRRLGRLLHIAVVLWPCRADSPAAFPLSLLFTPSHRIGWGQAAPGFPAA